MDYKKISIALSILTMLLLAALALTYFKTKNLSAAKTNTSGVAESTAESEALEEALDQPPKEKNAKVIAKIGDREITLTELQSEIQKLPPGYPVNFNDKKGKVDFLKQYIGVLLLYQEAQKKGLANDPEILKQTLETKKGLMVDKYLNAEIPIPEISDSEVEVFYAMNKAQLPGRKYEEIKDQLKFELIQQKRREAYNNLVAKLIQDDKVKIFEDKL